MPRYFMYRRTHSKHAVIRISFDPDEDAKEKWYDMTGKKELVDMQIWQNPSLQFTFHTGLRTNMSVNQPQVFREWMQIDPVVQLAGNTLD